MWLNGDHDKENLIKKAFNQAAGDFYVWMRPNIILPNLWLKWMYHYFRWYPQAGAVKAMSSRDNYQEILQNVPPDQRPNSFPEIADYFFYVLMGNQVTADTIRNDHACIMLSKVAYEQVSEQLEDPLTTHTMQALGMLLKSNEFSLWNAVEVFGYPKEDLKIGSSMAGFELNKAIRHPTESLTRPEDAETIQVFAENHTNDFVYKTDESEKKNSVLNFISKARKYKKEKQFEKAIYLLEEAKKLLEPIESNEKQVLSLLEESKVYKKKKEYIKSIELLEEAKQKIA
jgi:tetratricopeptide (TPR) repeat protein